MKLIPHDTAIAHAPSRVVVSITPSKLTTPKDPLKPPLSRTQEIYEISSQGRRYYRYVVTLGHEIEVSIHVRGGQTSNPKAINRVEQIRQWIRSGLSPETIVPMIRQWK